MHYVLDIHISEHETESTRNTSKFKNSGEWSLLIVVLHVHSITFLTLTLTKSIIVIKWPDGANPFPGYEDRYIVCRLGRTMETRTCTKGEAYSSNLRGCTSTGSRPACKL
jgi:hypothetical protein